MNQPTKALEMSDPAAANNSYSGNVLDVELHDLIVHLDSPIGLIRTGGVWVRGWVAARREIEEVTLEQDKPCRLDFEPRPDVASAYPSRKHVYGFAATVERPQFAGACVHLGIRTAGSVVHHLLPLPADDAEQKAIQRSKLTRLSGNLQCPGCQGEFSFPTGRKAGECAGCGCVYDRTESTFDFLPADLRDRFAIAGTENISSNTYDPGALSVIGECHAGMVLDCGAGLRNAIFPNVINFEVVPYPSTDVLGVNERLPFRDHTFDAVLSLSVLEHVRDPFQSAAEIRRVLKPGGLLYCSVPFLQPLHGYPHHYFNMTSGGLHRLFSEGISIEKSGVIASGLPIWSLAWMLRSWAEGLTGETKEAFLAKRVSELLGDPGSYLAEKFVAELPIEKNRELASCTVLLGRKVEKSQDQSRTRRDGRT